MSKPPRTPPNSDTDGVDQDRAPIDRPANARPDPGTRLAREESEAKAKPKGSRP